MQIDAELLLNYQRCRRRAFLDFYGDSEQRDSPNDYLLKLFQDSRENHRLVLANQVIHQPSYPHGDLTAGATATLELMQQGVEQIYQGVLITAGEAGVTLVSNPDLLIKQPGQSQFGDWLYMPAEIKLGKRPKLEYQIIAAFHLLVLGQVQGAWTETAWLLLREKGTYEVDLWDVFPQMQALLTECIQMLQEQQEPEVFIARSRCSLCHWLNHCHAIAKADHHLSLLPGVTAARYLQLQERNLTTVKALADANPAHLELLPGFGAEAAYRLVRQAKSTLHNCALISEDHKRGTDLSLNGSSGTTSHRHPARQFEQELPTAAIELYFDIEAEPALDLVYLHGVLVVDRHNQTTNFHALVAETPEDEAIAWQQFLDLAWRYPNAPIFHFCPYEAQTVERLAKLYGTPTQHTKPLLHRFVDLHERVTRLVTLPVESYALKPIARWLGFEWQDPNASGPQSICWYSQWLATGDRTYLNSILTYNEDDCRATHHIKEWLVGFLQEIYAAELA